MKLLFTCAFLVFFTGHLFAQACSGGLGDPVVNITFGSGSNPGPALAAGITSYTYLTDPCPNDGQYTISSHIKGCHNNTWFEVYNHTENDPDGYMMIINADYDPGVFFVDTAKGLCSNTTYEFSAWIMNILVPGSCGSTVSNPDITFNIETTTGIGLGTYSTGTIAQSSTAIWTRYYFYFKTQQDIDKVVIRLRNNAKGGCGNDLALDDITFRACGPKIMAGDGNNINNTNITQCENNMLPVMLQATVSDGYNDPVFQWQKSTDNGITWNNIPGATTTSLTVTPTAKGTILYRMAAAERGNIGSKACGIVSNNVTITVNPIPATGIGSNSPVCENDNLQLKANNGKSWMWTGPKGFISSEQNPSFTAHIVNAGKYYLRNYTGNNNCSTSDSTLVVVNSLPIISAGNDVEICEGNSTTLHASGGTEYIWSPTTSLSDAKNQAPVARPLETITYTVKGTANRCTGTDDVKVQVWKGPKANAGPGKKILQGQTIMLNGEASGDDISYSWLPDSDISDNTILQPMVTPAKDITYTLSVSSPHCNTATDDVFVKVFKKLIIPNAFSPNNDGANDYWRLESLQVYPQSTVEVYNRYGQIVFSATGKDSPVWDGAYNGKPMPAGGYSYIIDLKNRTPILSGILFIVR